MIARNVAAGDSRVTFQVSGNGVFGEGDSQDGVAVAEIAGEQRAHEDHRHVEHRHVDALLLGDVAEPWLAPRQADGGRIDL